MLNLTSKIYQKSPQPHHPQNRPSHPQNPQPPPTQTKTRPHRRPARRDQRPRTKKETLARPIRKRTARPPNPHRTPQNRPKRPKRSKCQTHQTTRLPDSQRVIQAHPRPPRATNRPPRGLLPPSPPTPSQRRSPRHHRKNRDQQRFENQNYLEGRRLNTTPIPLHLLTAAFSTACLDALPPPAWTGSSVPFFCTHHTSSAP